jgi:arsenate reductase
MCYRKFIHSHIEVNSLKVQILHNPRCSKSRATLEVLRNEGIEPEIILYQDAPPDTDQLISILEKLDMQPRDLMRKGQSEYKQMQLDNTQLSDEELIAAMRSAPILIERPIVLANGKASIGRPPESVLEIL